MNADFFIVSVGGSSTDTGTSGTDKKVCGPVKCPGGKPKTCAYGYQKKDGCEICRCDDPCNPPGKVFVLFENVILNDLFLFISLYFVDQNNDVLSIRNLMGHLELVAIHQARTKAKETKVEKVIRKVNLYYYCLYSLSIFFSCL
jgi:hypothetical protein